MVGGAPPYSYICLDRTCYTSVEAQGRLGNRFAASTNPQAVCYDGVVPMAEQTSSLVFLQYLTTVFDNIADGVLLIGVEPRDTFKLVMANKTFFEFSGYPDDSIGKK